VFFAYLSARHEAIYLEGMRQQARTLFGQVVLMRKWVADHGGIFVEQLPWVEPNPYLQGSEVAAGGRKFIKENPARVTRELSIYAREHGAFWFNITSLKLVNPDNAPDAFEAAALMKFETQGMSEDTTVATIEGREFYRYIAPLYIEAACLECHARHGYKLGDVRGAISVTIPMETAYAQLRQERALMGTAALVIALATVVSLGLVLTWTVALPVRALRDRAIGWFGREGAGSAPPGMGCSPSPGMDEIAELESVLQCLQRQATGYREDLERRVGEATTELQEMNRQLALARDRHQRDSRQKSEFIAALSHELRTPLTSTKGAVNYVHERLLAETGACAWMSEDLLPFVDITRRNLDRFVTLVEDTLDLEKIEAGQVDLNPERLSPATILRELREEALPLAEPSGVSLVVEDAEASDEIVADADRLKQILMNLVVNAVRVSPRGEAVTLECYASGQLAIFRVRDHGPGVPQEMKQKIFKRYVKGSPGGTGLGLTIARSLTEAMGGTIGVDSDGTNGAAFYVKLPAMGAEAMGGSAKGDG
jgi:signal transduction histidine kinase